jgi:hypothetical protein
LAAAADRAEALWVAAAVVEIGAEEVQASATADFAAARAAPVREAAAGDLPTAVRRAAAIVLPFNPFQDPANPARAIQAAGDPVLEDRHQILLDPESRDRIGPVSANRVIDRVIDQAMAIGLVTDLGTVPETATDRASLEKGTVPAIGRAVVIGPATSRAMATGPATSRAMVTGPATSRVMATARAIDPVTVRGFTRRLTATDLATVRAIGPITVTDRAPASPAIPTIRAAVRRTGTDIGSPSITVGITARGTGTGITVAPIGIPIRGARGALQPVPSA